jgi:uncharacterized protein YjbI with pentapeptide repeats
MSAALCSLTHTHTHLLTHTRAELVNFMEWNRSLRVNSELGLTLSQINLVHAFTSCIFTSCIFTSCIFTSCIFMSCIFTSCIFTSCIFTSCIFTSCIFTSCIFNSDFNTILSFTPGSPKWPQLYFQLNVFLFI